MEEILFQLEPEPDPRPCSCKSKWLTPTPSPDPDLYEQWACGRCGNRVIRIRPRHFTRQ